MPDSHKKTMKLYCRVCQNTNKLEKAGTMEIYFFCLGDPKFRICKYCKEKCAAHIQNGKQFSEEMTSYGINGKSNFYMCSNTHGGAHPGQRIIVTLLKCRGAALIDTDCLQWSS